MRLLLLLLFTFNVHAEVFNPPTFYTAQPSSFAITGGDINQAPFSNGGWVYSDQSTSAGDASISFIIEGNAPFYAGFFSDGGVTDVAGATIFNNNGYGVFYNGSSTLTTAINAVTDQLLGAFTTGDKVTISIIGSDVTYYKNDVAIFTYAGTTLSYPYRFVFSVGASSGGPLGEVADVIFTNDVPNIANASVFIPYGPAIDNPSQLENKGDLLTNNGIFDVVLPIGTSGQVLVVDFSTPTGMKWIDPVFPSPTVNQGDLIIRGASSDVALPIGPSGYALVSNGTTAVWEDLSVTQSAGITDQAMMAAIARNNYSFTNNLTSSVFLTGKKNLSNIFITGNTGTTNGFVYYDEDTCRLTTVFGSGHAYTRIAIIDAPSSNYLDSLAGFFDSVLSKDGSGNLKIERLFGASPVPVLDISNVDITNNWVNAAAGYVSFFENPSAIGHKVVLIADAGAGDRVAVLGPDSWNDTYSPTNWTTVTVPAQDWKLITFGHYGAGWSGGEFVAVSTDTAGSNVMTSVDGYTWVSRTTPTIADFNDWEDIEYGTPPAYPNGIYVVVSSSGSHRAMYSTDKGVTWNAVITPFQGTFKSVYFDGFGFTAISDTSSTGNPSVMTSLDGVNWSTLDFEAGSTGFSGIAGGKDSSSSTGVSKMCLFKSGGATANGAAKGIINVYY